MEMLILPAFITLYLLPSICAVFRKHNNQTPVFLVNLFFGWTILGWLVALIWSGTDNVRKTEVAK
jgi:hypothetical protein